jgi:lipid II:glycine glycyltransferase (peptidoglycan interpeptide bridge formation enzyme)
MLVTEREFGIFKIKHLFFAEEPVNVSKCDVITYHTYKDWGDINGYKKTMGPTTVIDLSRDTDTVWNNIKRQHKRHILRAQKNGTQVTISKNFEEFHKNYRKFLHQRNFGDPLGFGIPSSKFMEKYGILFIAQIDDETCGENFYIHDDRNALLTSSAYLNAGNNSDMKKKITDSNCYLHWEAMQYFKNKDIVRFDLGGLGSDEIIIDNKMHGLNYFKLSFGGEVIYHYKYMKFNSQFYKFLYNRYNTFRGRI